MSEVCYRELSGSCVFHGAVDDSSAILAQQLLLALDSIQQNQCCVDKVVRVYNRIFLNPSEITLAFIGVGQPNNVEC